MEKKKRKKMKDGNNIKSVIVLFLITAVIYGLFSVAALFIAKARTDNVKRRPVLYVVDKLRDGDEPAIKNFFYGVYGYAMEEDCNILHIEKWDSSEPAIIIWTNKPAGGLKKIISDPLTKKKSGVRIYSPVKGRVVEGTLYDNSSAPRFFIASDGSARAIISIMSSEAAGFVNYIFEKESRVYEVPDSFDRYEQWRPELK